MEIKQTGNKKRFKPIKIKIKFKNQKEYDMFYFLFNYAPICDTMRAYAEIDIGKIRVVLNNISHYKEYQSILDLFKEMKK